MLYHFHVTQVRRSAGSSVIASAAYRAGEKLYDERYGEVCDYTRKPGVIFSEIVLPDNAPSEYKDRATLTILDFYAKRWDIEVFFRQVKQKLALNKYQIRSAAGIQRFWTLMSLAYLMCCLESERMSFTDGYALFQKAIKTERVEFIYRCARNQYPRGTGCCLLA